MRLFEKLTSPDEHSATAAIRESIQRARQLQQERFTAPVLFNTEMQIPHLKQYCGIDEKSKAIVKRFVDSGALSARGYHRVLKVARTIADLDNSERIAYDHVTEALMYRVREG